MHVFQNRTEEKLIIGVKNAFIIGYSEQSKSYKLYNPINKKFVVSRDVKILEDKSWSSQENEAMDRRYPYLSIYEQVESLGQEVTLARL